MVVLSGSFSCCWLPLEVTVPCIHSPLTVHCCLAALVPRSHELQRAGNHLWGQRETSQHLKAVGIGLPNSLLTPEGAVMFQLLSELDGVGLCLQIWYRGKPLKFRTPLFITQSPVLYENGDPVELNVDVVLKELLCFRDYMQASHSQARKSASLWQGFLCTLSLGSGVTAHMCSRNIQGWEQWGQPSLHP